MAVGFQHPAVKTHIGDGFKFLADKKNEFDVIITDSSDPEGPAENLFKQPYFELLYGALKEGGVITTQGCPFSSLFVICAVMTHPFLPLPVMLRCDLVMSSSIEKPRGLTCLMSLIAENQWLHLSLITSLSQTCKAVFPTVQYAYTTIPTYPSGQIGFMVCCKDSTRDVTKPLRSWSVEEEEKLCRYYNKAIHEASFVLPTFARRALRP